MDSRKGAAIVVCLAACGIWMLAATVALVGGRDFTESGLALALAVGHLILANQCIAGLKAKGE